MSEANYFMELAFMRKDWYIKKRQQKANDSMTGSR
jgi:hypothetical protein